MGDHFMVSPSVSFFTISSRGSDWDEIVKNEKLSDWDEIVKNEKFYCKKLRE